jgi:hypothetical protein
MPAKKWLLWGGGLLLVGALTALMVALFRGNQVASPSTASAPRSGASSTTVTAAGVPRPLPGAFKGGLRLSAPGRVMTAKEKEQYLARVERWHSPLVRTRLPPPDPDAPVTFARTGKGDEVTQEAINRVKGFFVEADLSDEQQRRFLELLRDYQYRYDAVFVHVLDGMDIETGDDSADLLFGVQVSIEEDLPIATAQFLTENQQQILMRTILPYVTTVTTTGVVGDRWQEAFREPAIAER